MSWRVIYLRRLQLILFETPVPWKKYDSRKGQLLAFQRPKWLFFNDYLWRRVQRANWCIQTSASRIYFICFQFSQYTTFSISSTQNWPSDNCFLSTTSTYIVPLSLMGLATSLKMYVRGINIQYLLVKSKFGSIARRRGVRNYALRNEQGHPTSSFGKYLFGRRFEI